MVEIDRAFGDRKEGAEFRSHGLVFSRSRATAQEDLSKPEVFRCAVGPLREKSFSWRVWPSVELLVQPSEYTCFCAAERLDPAVEQEFGAAALERDLLRLLHD